MRRPVTIVMYHYVRPLQRTRFPAIKGLDVERFRGQVEYLCRHYTPVSMDQVIAAGQGDELPPRPVLLTFDDGYSDHYQYVLPELAERKISGAFFVPSSVVLDRTMLNVNKIHFVVAAAPSPAPVIAEMERLIEAETDRTGLQPLPDYRGQYMAAGRLDPAEVMYIKHMLQHALPEPLRNRIVASLFARFVSADETAFAEELYVTRQQLGLMIEAGMHVGSHGARHYWLDRLTPAEQARDIDQSLDLFDAIDQPRTDFTFCYPYGGYNAATLDILRQRGCAAAVTTRMQVAEVGGGGDLLELARLDTNHLPMDPSAPAPRGD